MKLLVPAEPTAVCYDHTIPGTPEPTSFNGGHGVTGCSPSSDIDHQQSESSSTVNLFVRTVQAALICIVT